MKLFISIIFSIFLSSTLVGQWEPLGGPYGGYVNQLAKNDNYIFAATTNGLFRSGDIGHSWQQLNLPEGITYASIQVGVLNNLVVTDAVNYIDGQVRRYLFKSLDSGNTWEEINRPATNGFLIVALNQHFICVTDHYDVWTSSDEGQNWDSNSINNQFDSVLDLQVFDGEFYLTSLGHLFKSNEDGNEFHEITLSPAISFIASLYVEDSLMLLKDDYGKYFRSEDGGINWEQHGINFTEFGNFTKAGEAFFMNAKGTIFRSTDDGKNWVDLHPVGLSNWIYLIMGFHDNLITGSQYVGISASNDKGLSFHERNIGLSTNYVNTILIDDATLLAGSELTGISRYDIAASTWDTIPFLVADYPVTDIFRFQNEIYEMAGPTVLKTSDKGNSWADVSPEDGVWIFENFYASGNSILVGGNESCILYISHDKGYSWEPFEIEKNGEIINPYLFAHHHDKLFVGTYDSLYRSSDNGITWETSMNGLILEDQHASIYKMFSVNNILFVTEYYKYPFKEHRRLHVSYDDGDHWQLSMNGISTERFPYGFNTITNIGNVLIAGMFDYGHPVYVSYDDAETWTPFYEGLYFGDIKQITSDLSNIYLASTGQGVWRRKISDLYITSTKQPVLNNDIFIFPNPSNGNFTLKLNEVISGNVNVVISDVNGRVRQKTNITLKAQTEIDTENLASGLYLITLQTGDKIYTSRIIIQ